MQYMCEFMFKYNTFMCHFKCCNKVTTITSHMPSGIHMNTHRVSEQEHFLARLVGHL
jgi:hypothetical protein